MLLTCVLQLPVICDQGMDKDCRDAGFIPDLLQACKRSSHPQPCQSLPKLPLLRALFYFFLLKWNLLSVLCGVRWCLSAGVLLGSGVSKNLSDGGVWEAVVSLPQVDHLEVFPSVC